MPWTDHYKGLIATEHFNSVGRYVALGISGAEIAGHGYSRKAWLPSQMNASSVSGGSITNSAILEVFTATDATAQDATQVAIFDSLSGGQQLTTWQNLSSNVAAPVNGQGIRFPIGDLVVNV